MPIMPCKKCTWNFKKQYFERKLKNWPFQIIARAVQCNIDACQVKLGTFIFFILNKSISICLRTLRDIVI